MVKYRLKQHTHAHTTITKWATGFAERFARSIQRYSEQSCGVHAGCLFVWYAADGADKTYALGNCAPHTHTGRVRAGA